MARAERHGESSLREAAEEQFGCILRVGEGRYRLRSDLSFTTAASVLRDARSAFRGVRGAVEIDLAEVRRADSAGVALLIELVRLADREGGPELHFTHLPEQLATLAAVSGVARLLPCQA